MKALVKSHTACGLWLADVPEPEPGINDVKIRVLCTGICGTDLHIYDWNEWAQSTIPVPLVIGHEFSGEIELASNSGSIEALLPLFVRGLAVSQMCFLPREPAASYEYLCCPLRVPAAYLGLLNFAASLKKYLSSYR